jgi:hypothetical protein
VGWVARAGGVYMSRLRHAPSGGNCLTRSLAEVAVMASLAKIERTRAGMERVRQHGSKSGKAIGRPSISDRTRARIVEMLAAGTGIRATARAVGTGNETVHRIAREMRANANATSGPSPRGSAGRAPNRAPGRIGAYARLPALPQTPAASPHPSRRRAQCREPSRYPVESIGSV